VRDLNIKLWGIALLLGCSAILLPAQTTNAPAGPMLAPASPKTPIGSTAVMVPPVTIPPAPPALKPDPFSDPLIKQVVARQEKAVNGDEKETKALTADLEKWTKEQPKNHLLQAYLGSTYTLCSRDAWPGPGKLSYLRKGGHLMNEAVAAEPFNPAVRLVRAIDFFELPAIFGQRQKARDDFQFLMKQVNGEIKLPYALDIDTVQAIYYYSGLSLRQQWQDDGARAVWKRGWKLDPASPIGVKIKDELAKLQ
jgi:hypothetical protein